MSLDYYNNLPRGLFGASNEPKTALSDQKTLLNPKNKVSNINDPFAYLENVKAPMINQKDKREGNITTAIADDSSVEQIIYRNSRNFITDERDMVTQSVNNFMNRRAEESTPLTQRLPYHDIDASGQKTRQDRVFNVPEKKTSKPSNEEPDAFEEFMSIRKLDDLKQEIPAVHTTKIESEKTQY